MSCFRSCFITKRRQDFRSCFITKRRQDETLNSNEPTIKETSEHGATNFFLPQTQIQKEVEDRPQQPPVVEEIYIKDSSEHGATNFFLKQQKQQELPVKEHVKEFLLKPKNIVQEDDYVKDSSEHGARNYFNEQVPLVSLTTITSSTLSKDDEEEEEEKVMESTEKESFGRDRRVSTQVHSKRQNNSITKIRNENANLMSTLFDDIVGGRMNITTNFGVKQTIHCDWTASGKPLNLIEKYILSTVLPYYANTHSIESRFGLQTSCFREEAREIIQLACNANRTKDVVIFCGNGVTAAINKLITCLGLNEVNDEECVVFLGPYEHTSNLVTWRETGVKIVNIPECKNGVGLDQDYLKNSLEKHSNYKMKIGSFSACSNVTGILERVDEVTTILHKNGALSFWDYATAGPYCEIDMNPVSTDINTRSFLHKDAVFISTHKFIGGVGGSGVLIAKKNLFNNQIPQNCGGGTVYFVDSIGHRFLSETVEREEGGTPNIVGDIRAGLAFKLKQSIGVDRIKQREEEIIRKVNDGFKRSKNLCVVGPSSTNDFEKLAIFSFLIRRNGRFLHHHYVVALLNDLYGIQSRAGCLCAGPYVQKLLGMSNESVSLLEKFLLESTNEREQYRPGVTRISIPYFFPNEVIDYVIQAIVDISEYGWRLLPLYRYENVSGEWGHRNHFQKHPTRIWLADLFDQGEKSSPNERNFLILEQQVEEALQIMLNPPHSSNNNVVVKEEDDNDWMRWFVLPSEAYLDIQKNETILTIVQPEKYFDLIQSLNQSPQEITLCPIIKKTRRDRKQPKRFASSSKMNEDDELVENKKGAFDLTVEKTSSITKQMTNAELFPSIPSEIMRLVVLASKEWSMINPGDRLLLGLSGGKDSLCLLHALIQIQKRAPFKFDLACCTIDPGAGEAFDPSPLIPYVKSLGIPYFFQTTDIFACAKETLPAGTGSYCSYCARMKRGTLYRVARENGFTALVLAQHLDDFVESFFMSAIRNGSLRTMKANYVEDRGEVRVIRPLCYVRERETKQFSYQAKLPVINENCPACFSAPSERARIKTFLKDQENLIPGFFESVGKAIVPLMDGDVYSKLDDIYQRLKLSKQVNEATKNAKEYGLEEKKKRNKDKQKTKDNVEDKGDFSTFIFHQDQKEE